MSYGLNNRICTSVKFTTTAPLLVCIPYIPIHDNYNIVSPLWLSRGPCECALYSCARVFQRCARANNSETLGGVWAWPRLTATQLKNHDPHLVKKFRRIYMPYSSRTTRTQTHIRNGELVANFRNDLNHLHQTQELLWYSERISPTLILSYSKKKIWVWSFIWIPRSCGDDLGTGCALTRKIWWAHSSTIIWGQSLSYELILLGTINVYVAELCSLFMYSRK